jgi:S-DNA-T family DNA segregation ATPase FtsK/SpoIIIE
MDPIIGAGLATFIMYAAAKWNKNDKEKIRHTFKNIGYTVGDQEPRLFKTHKTDTYTLYTYHTPYGLVDNDKLNVLEKVLNKPVDVSFTNQKLHVRVYKNKIPVKIEYEWSKTDGWTIPIGQSYSDLILHDFDKIPHMTIAGMTRQGKTVLLKLILAHLINNHPEDAEFHLIDLKGGLEFNRYANLKQVKNIASDVKESHDLLQSIKKQIRDDMRRFKQEGYTNIIDTPISQRRFIFVDEGAELTPDRHHSKDEKIKYHYCQYVLSEIARVAGALGCRLIFATQYPTADTLPRQIKQNSDAKISFRLATEVASRVAIDEQGAEQLPHPGRAIYRTHTRSIIQVPYIGDVDIQERLGDYFVSSAGENESETRTDHVEFG